MPVCVRNQSDKEETALYDELHDEALNDVYTKYSNAHGTRQKTNVLSEGVKNIFVNIHKYIDDQNTFKEKSDRFLTELENLLQRFYYFDTLFIDRITFEAKAYILELAEEHLYS